MKKIILVIFIICCLIGVSYAAPATNNSGPGDILGQGKLDSQAHKIFRLVRYVPAAGTDNIITLSKDSIVIWDTTSDDGVTVTLSATTKDSRIAGVMASTCLTPDLGGLGNTATQDIGHRNWGWLQTYGWANVTQNGTYLAVAGDAFSNGAQQGTAGPYSVGTTPTTCGKAGFYLDSVAVGASVNVMITGLD